MATAAAISSTDGGGGAGGFESCRKNGISEVEKVRLESFLARGIELPYRRCGLANDLLDQLLCQSINCTAKLMLSTNERLKLVCPADDIGVHVVNQVAVQC